MYNLTMTFPFTIEERAALYLLLQKLKKDTSLRISCDHCVLIPFFERFIEESLKATFINPFENTEL